MSTTSAPCSQLPPAKDTVFPTLPRVICHGVGGSKCTSAFVVLRCSTLADLELRSIAGPPHSPCAAAAATAATNLNNNSNKSDDDVEKQEPCW